MPASVLDNIVADLVTTIQGVTVLNGFDFTIATVERFEAEGNSLVNLPATFISTMPQKRLLETRPDIMPRAIEAAWYSAGPWAKYLAGTNYAGGGISPKAIPARSAGGTPRPTESAAASAPTGPT